MSRGKKLDLLIGSSLDDASGWSFESEEKTSKKEILDPQKHTLYFAKERRRGKIVTLVGEFFVSDEVAKDLLAKIKKRLGCGGAYKEGFMEFQGELQEKLKPLIEESGFKVKKGK